jgi:SAM-dependent methyltransferase
MSKVLHLHYPPEYEADIWRRYRLEVIAHCINSAVLEGLLLDIGCNDCSIIRFLSSGCYKYLGVDLSISALKEGKPQERIQGDACFLPIKDSTVDIVICSEIIEHLEQPHSMLEEIARVLKPNGKLVISTPNKESIFLQIQNLLPIPRFHDWKYVESHFQVYSPKEFDALLEKHGFTIREKAKSIAFPPFKFTKRRYPFRIFCTISKAIPEDFQELLIRMAAKTN